MARLSEVVSPDGNWKAKVEVSGLLNDYYNLIVKRRGIFSLFSKRRKLSLGMSYYEPNIALLQPDMPIANSMQVSKPRFAGNSVEVDIKHVYYYSHQPPREEAHTERLPLY